MRYYPIFLDIKGKPCTVVGGGSVAERKVESLLGAGASVTVVSPRVTKKIKTLSEGKKIRLIKRGYKKGDVKGALLLICASGDREVNKAARSEAESINTLVNVVDDPPLCDFIAPSIVDRGDLLIAISTSGKIPFLSRALRLRLEAQFGREYETFVGILGAIRKKLLKKQMDYDKKGGVFNALLDSDMPHLISRNATKEINVTLKNLLGSGFSLSELGINVRKGGTSNKTKKMPSGNGE